MKVRIGVSTGAASADGDDLLATCRAMEDLGFDSVWIPDVLSQPVDDPLTALAFVAGALGRLKLGTTLVLPGRNPVRLAREVATVDRLSKGRLLLTVVPGLRRRRELAALGVDAASREGQLDEGLALLRRLWSGERVDHDGPNWQLHDVQLSPTPVQDPFDVWVGGIAPSALRRAGRLADGWLPSLCTPAEAAAGRALIEEEAAAAGRTISPEHFGVSIAYLEGPAPAAVLQGIGRRRPGIDVEQVVPEGLGALRALLERYLEAGFSKFVVRPLLPPASWPDALDALATAVLDLQT